MGEVVGNAATALSLEAPVERQTDLMHGTSRHLQWAQATRDQCTRLDLAAWSADQHPITVLDLVLGGKFWAEFGKESRLQGIEPRHPARHRSTHMMLGQAIGRNHNWIIGVSYLGQYIIFALLIHHGGGITLLLVQQVLHR